MWRPSSPSGSGSTQTTADSGSTSVQVGKQVTPTGRLPSQPVAQRVGIDRGQQQVRLSREVPRGRFRRLRRCREMDEPVGHIDRRAGELSRRLGGRPQAGRHNLEDHHAHAQHDTPPCGRGMPAIGTKRNTPARRSVNVARDDHVPPRPHARRRAPFPDDDAGLRRQGGGVRPGHHRGPERRDDRRHAHLREAGAAVPRPHRRVRSQGPVAARGAHPEPEGARHRARAGRRAQGQGAALRAARHPDRAEGQLRHLRHADHRRLGAARRLDPSRRCVRGEEAAGRRRDHPGQGQHVGVRVGRRAQLARRPDAEPARSGAHAVGLLRRHRRLGRGRLRAGRPRHRHRRLGARPLHLERHRRAEADARAAQP